MKGIKLFIITLVFAFSFSTAIQAESAQYITGYTTGKVLAYEGGKKLEVLHHEGTKKIYFIPETAEIPKDLKVGDKVEVKEVGKAAVGVEILSRGKK
ncbi:MAG: hypothetical protein OEV42_10125 [Deltaproteobacteria bacterium]|nr:hypothetical protein [Deltaproteobacteria bacterium]